MILSPARIPMSTSFVSRYLRRQNAGDVTFRKNTVILATSVGDEKPFSISITSSKPLAHGSTAVIYEGRIQDQELDHGRVALKVFTNAVDEDRAREQLIRREVRAAHQAQHRYILPLLGMALTERHTIIVYPFMKNGNMLRYLKDSPQKNRNTLVLHIAEAINYLHTVHGLVHGDLKCENVLISDEGTALLTDFGLSTFVDKSTRTHVAQTITTSAPPSVNLQDILSLTLPEVRLLHTTGFAGPELLYTTDPQTDQLPSKNMQLDVYAFGMLMIQTFTGAPPWPGCTPQAIVLKIHSKTVHPHPGQAATARGLIDSWWQSCLRCMDYEPKLRPSMAQLLAELSSTLRAHEFVRNLIVSSMERFSKGASSAPSNLLGPLELPDLSAVDQQWFVNNRGSLLNEIAQQRDQLQGRGNDDQREAVLASLRSLEDSINNRPVEHTEVSTSQAFDASPVELEGHTDRVTSLAFISSSLVVSSSADETIRVWDTDTHKAAGEPIFGHTDAINWLAVSRDSSQVASISADQTLRLWTFNQGKFMGAGSVLQASNILSCAFSPDGLFLVCGSYNGEIRVWDIATGEQLGTALRGHTGAVRALAFSADSTRMVSGSGDQTVRLWAWNAGTETTVGLTPLGDPLISHTGVVYSVAFSPDGKSVASGARDNTVRIWDAHTHRLRLTLLGHTHGITCAAFSPTEPVVASASSDNTIRIWDAVTGEVVGLLKGKSPGHWVNSIIFAPDGDKIVSGSSDGIARVWSRVAIQGNVKLDS